MALARKVATPAVCLMSAALFGYNGVADAAPPAPQARTNVASAAAPLNELGTGVASAYVSGCTPTLSGDFIDTANWGYRMVEPRDCTLVRMATPIFSWPMPADRLAGSPMILVLSRPDGSTVSRSTTSTRVLLTDAALSGGQHQWHVSYTNRSGAIVKSQPRRFTIESKANLLSLPGGVAFADNVAAKSHPRALPKGASFADIVLKAKNGDYRNAYANFSNLAVSLKGSAPQPAPLDKIRSDFSTEVEFNAFMTSVGRAAGTARKAIETLGYAGHFSGDASYHDAAITHLLALATWAPTGASSELRQDQANREVYLGLSIGLDLLHNRLSPEQRGTIVKVLKDRLNQVMVKFDRLDQGPNDSHMLTATSYTTEALMYAVGTPEFPEAKALLATSWGAYVTLLGAWSGSTDGAFANSTAYGWYTMNVRARMFASIRLIADLDLTPMPAAGNFGDNQIAFTAPNTQLRSPFGDELEVERHYTDYSHDSYRLYASVTGKPEHEWYWRVRPTNVTLGTALPPLHYLMLGLRTPVAPSATPVLPKSWVFEDAGMVALHSETTDPARSSVFFRSSRFGSANHSHADNNAFTFVSHGKAMLISGGYDPYFASPHHLLVGRATRFKNALTFDGGIGQSEPVLALTAQSVPGKPNFSMQTRGRLINFADTGAWAVTTGDATLAYRGSLPGGSEFAPFLSNAIRSVGFNREKKVVVVYDWATSDTARTWELNFQTLQPAVLSGKTVRVTNGAVNACVDVYGTPGAFAFSSGFPVAPESTDLNRYPIQHQTRYRAAAPSKQLVSVTVIREDCAEVAVNVAFTGTSASVAIAGATPLTFDRKTIRSQ